MSESTAQRNKAFVLEAFETLFNRTSSQPRSFGHRMVILHGRFSGLGLPANWIVVDIVRIENGLLAEHWDVIEDEVTRETSASGLPMFGAAFPS
jgi:hypothetical protein